MTDPTRDEPVMTRPGRRSRRTVLGGLAGGIDGLLALPAIGILPAPYGIARGDDGGGNSGSGGGHSGRGGGEAGGAQPPEPGAVPAGSLEIRIVDDEAQGFSPGTLTVDPGQSITFVNADHDAHTATGSRFDTGVIQPGGIATVVLDEPGTFAYACQIHPVMSGSIGVRGPDGTVPPPTQPGPVPADAMAVRIASFAFEPASVTIPVGATVVWTNADTVPHTVTALDGSFDSGIFDPGATFSWSFTVPGGVSYHCNLHPQMQGTVVVGDASAATGVEAPAGDTDAPASPGSPVGVWLLALTPDPGSEMPAQRALMTVHADGTLETVYAATEESTASTPVIGPGQGTWEADAAGGYTFTLVALLVDGAQRFAGTLTLREAGRLTGAGDDYRGTFTFEMTGGAGTASATGGGTTRGTRLRPGTSKAAPAATPATPTLGSPSSTVDVTIRDFAFDPPTLEIPVGETVTWSNQGQAPHTATAMDGAFDTGQLDPGQRASHTFDRAGSLTYRCNIHPDMSGTIVVG
jgi:plastocyanin